MYFANLTNNNNGNDNDKNENMQLLYLAVTAVVLAKKMKTKIQILETDLEKEKEKIHVEEGDIVLKTKFINDAGKAIKNVKEKYTRSKKGYLEKNNAVFLALDAINYPYEIGNYVDSIIDKTKTASLTSLFDNNKRVQDLNIEIINLKQQLLRVSQKITSFATTAAQSQPAALAAALIATQGKGGSGVSLIAGHINYIIKVSDILIKQLTVTKNSTADLTIKKEIDDIIAILEKIKNETLQPSSDIELTLNKTIELQEQIDNLKEQLKEQTSRKSYEQCTTLIKKKNINPIELYEYLENQKKTGAITTPEILDVYTQLKRCNDEYEREIINNTSCRKVHKKIYTDLPESKQDPFNDNITNVSQAEFARIISSIEKDNRNKKYVGKMKKCKKDYEGLPSEFDFDYFTYELDGGGEFVTDAEDEVILRYLHEYLAKSDVGGKWLEIYEDNTPKVNLKSLATSTQLTAVYESLAGTLNDTIKCDENNYGLEIFKINVGGTAFAYPIFAITDYTNSNQVKSKEIYVVKIFLEPLTTNVKLKDYQLAYKELDYYKKFDDEPDKNGNLFFVIKGRKMDKICEYNTISGNSPQFFKFENLKYEYKDTTGGDKILKLTLEDFLKENCKFVYNKMVLDSMIPHYNSQIKSLTAVLFPYDVTDNSDARKHKYTNNLNMLSMYMIEIYSTAGNKYIYIDNFLDTTLTISNNKIMLKYGNFPIFVEHWKSNINQITGKIFDNTKKPSHIKTMTIIYHEIIKDEDTIIFNSNGNIDLTIIIINNNGTYTVKLNMILDKIIYKLEPNFAGISEYHQFKTYNSEDGTETIKDVIHANFKEYIEYKKMDKESIIIGNTRTDGGDYEYEYINTIKIVYYEPVSKTETITCEDDGDDIILVVQLMDRSYNLFKPHLAGTQIDNILDRNYEFYKDIYVYLEICISIEFSSNITKNQYDAIILALNKIFNNYFYGDEFACCKINILDTTLYFVSREMYKYKELKKLSDRIKMNKLKTKEEKMLRFCTESKLQQYNYKTHFLLLEFMSKGEMCEILNKHTINDKQIINHTITIIFQIFALYTKFNLFHADLHVNNVMFTLDSNFDGGQKKYYKIKYKLITKTKDVKYEKELFIPVYEIIPKVVDFDKSKFVDKIKEDIKKRVYISDNIPIYSTNYMKTELQKLATFSARSKLKKIVKPQAGGSNEISLLKDVIGDFYKINISPAKYKAPSPSILSVAAVGIMSYMDSKGKKEDLTQNKDIYFFNTVDIFKYITDEHSKLKGSEVNYKTNFLVEEKIKTISENKIETDILLEIKSNKPAQFYLHNGITLVKCILYKLDIINKSFFYGKYKDIVECAVEINYHTSEKLDRIKEQIGYISYTIDDSYKESIEKVDEYAKSDIDKKDEEPDNFKKFIDKIIQETPIYKIADLLTGQDFKNIVNDFGKIFLKFMYYTPLLKTRFSPQIGSGDVSYFITTMLMSLGYKEEIVKEDKKLKMEPVPVLYGDNDDIIRVGENLTMEQYCRNINTPRVALKTFLSSLIYAIDAIGVNENIEKYEKIKTDANIRKILHDDISIGSAKLEAAIAKSGRSASGRSASARTELIQLGLKFNSIYNILDYVLKKHKLFTIDTSIQNEDIIKIIVAKKNGDPTWLLSNYIYLINSEFEKFKQNPAFTNYKKDNKDRIDVFSKVLAIYKKIFPIPKEGINLDNISLQVKSDDTFRDFMRKSDNSSGISGKLDKTLVGIISKGISSAHHSGGGGDTPPPPSELGPGAASSAAAPAAPDKDGHLYGSLSALLIIMDDYLDKNSFYITPIDGQIIDTLNIEETIEEVKFD